MEIQIDTIDNAIVIKLTGSLDHNGLAELSPQVVTLVTSGRNLVFDLSEVDFLSSVGVRFLLDFYQKCQEEGAHLVLAEPSFEVREILMMTGLMASFLPIYDTLDEGLERFRSRGIPSFSIEEPMADEEPEEDEVNFLAYYPKEVTVEKWYTVLVYAFVSSALEAIRQDAQQFKDEIGEMREAKSATSARLARGTEVTVVPSCEGVTFNPERVSFKWLEEHHRVRFRMQAGASLAGLAGNATVTVYVGPVIVATLKLGMLFNETVADSVPVRSDEVVTRMHRQDEIFMSYSHRDTDIVLNCHKAYKALGFTVLIDRETLRSGQNWNDELMHMIERADIFQLFWSENAKKSEYVQQEWQHALQCKKEGGFIRPVYWEKPIPEPPSELADIHFDFAPFATQD